MKRFLSWLTSWLRLEAEERPAPSATVLEKLRLEHEQRVAAFNKALAASIQLRDVFAAQIQELKSKEATIQSQLQLKISAADDQAGTLLAVALREAVSERQDAEQRWGKAQEDVGELMRLRDEAIAKARDGFRDAADLVARAAGTSTHGGCGDR